MSEEVCFGGLGPNICDAKFHGESYKLLSEYSLINVQLRTWLTVPGGQLSTAKFLDTFPGASDRGRRSSKRCVARGARLEVPTLIKGRQKSEPFSFAMIRSKLQANIRPHIDLTGAQIWPM